jgi:hypothetical protein
MATALLLLGGHGLASSSSGLGVLSTNLDTPVMTNTTMIADSLESLEILTELAVKLVGKELCTQERGTFVSFSLIDGAKHASDGWSCRFAYVLFVSTLWESLRFFQSSQ